MTRFLPTVAAIAAIGIIAAGCGADSAELTVQANTTVSPRDSLTKAQFIDDANGVCMRNWHFVVEEFLEQRDALRTSEPELSDEERVAQATQSAYFDAMESYIVAEIQGIGAPPGQKAPVERLIGAMQEAIERGRLESVGTRAEVMELFDEYQQRADRYGISECRLSSLTLPRG